MFDSKFFRLSSLFATLLMAVSLAAAAPAEARMGGSFGSRGMRTYQSAPVTRIAPNTVAPVERSMTPNAGAYGTPGYNNGAALATGARGGFWSGLGGGLLGGLLGGLFFHGLFGSMLGFGFGGLGGGFSALFQILLLGGIAWFAFRWFRNQQPAVARGNGQGGFPPSGGMPGYGGQSTASGGPASGSGARQSANRDEIGIGNADLETFERLLADVQGAFAREDHQTLRRYTTPEMVSYLSEELADNATRGLRNDVSDLKFLEGDLAEAWREGSRDYATVAMRWSAIDVMRDRQTGEVREGNPDQPAEARELWTFTRERGGQWQLSAIQDARG